MNGSAGTNKRAPATGSLMGSGQITRFQERLLVEAISADYPGASGVLLSFPDDWEVVAKLTWGVTTLYVGAFPTEVERPSRDHFYGLSPEINMALDRYRHYKLFQPWPMPSIHAQFNQQSNTGRVTGYGPVRVQMREVGQAQVWFSSAPGPHDDLGSPCEQAVPGGTALIWEGYTFTSHRSGAWEEELRAFWEVIESDLYGYGARKVYTQPKEPAIPVGYEDFLSNLGYQADGECPAWWSKALAGEY